MAKRTSTRSKANDAATATPAQPKTRRARAGTAAEPDTIGAYPGVEGTEEDPNRSVASAGSHSESMASEPSADDIRMRAYQRYLERGGGHGMDFEDWLEAERELKRK
jgi:hypothetical protein